MVERTGLLIASNPIWLRQTKAVAAEEEGKKEKRKAKRERKGLTKKRQGLQPAEGIMTSANSRATK